jgi:hypothetical protein
LSEYSKICAGYDRQNRAAARIILADVRKHGGEQALAVMWAAAVVGRSFRELPKLPGAFPQIKPPGQMAVELEASQKTTLRYCNPSLATSGHLAQTEGRNQENACDRI